MKQLNRLEEQAAEPSFWEDGGRVQEYLKKSGALKEQLRPLRELEQLLEEAEVLLELAEEEGEGGELTEEAARQLQLIARKLDRLELETLFSGKHDHSNAIVSLHPGAGGVE